MRVLICGSRDWKWLPPMAALMRGLSEDPWVLIEGCARGADVMASKYYDQFLWGPSENHLHFPAKWNEYPKHLRWRAGHDRNQQMLDEGKPDVVFAFKERFNWKMDEGGTEDMVRRSKEAGIPAYVIERA